MPVRLPEAAPRQPRVIGGPLRRPLAALLVVWLLPGLVAAALLLHLFKGSPFGVLLHALVLLVLLLSGLLPALPELLRGARWPRRLLALCSGVLATIQWCLLAFYALAWAGHHYWGNWMNLELALAYAPQLPGLVAALDVPPLASGFATLALLLAWLALWALQWRLLGALADARAQVPAALGRGSGLALMLALLASLALLYRHYYLEPDFWWDEPVRQAGLSASFGQTGMGVALAPQSLRTEHEAAAAYPPRPATGPLRPLVLIIVDALRSDLTGVYGAPVDNTPFLSSLYRARQLQRVDDAYSVCTVSYCGILGTLASRHWHQMTPQPWGLADALVRLGYDARFILSGDHTSFYGLRTMYGSAPRLVLDGSNQSLRYSNDDRLVLDALDAQGWPADRPGFLYVHLMSAHRLGRVDEAYKRWNGADAPSFSGFEPLDPQAHPESRARYHNGILQADAMIRQIFERLKGLKLLDDALVIITADHGELVGELGLWSHGHVPYEPVVRIPLLVYDPKAAAPLPPRRLASHIDVAPTFLRAIGAPIPAHWAGAPLQEPLVRSALPLDSAEATGLVADEANGRFKYLRWRDSGAEKLFQLRPAGAGESVDLSPDPAHAGTLARLRADHARMTSP